MSNELFASSLCITKYMARCERIFTLRMKTVTIGIDFAVGSRLTGRAGHEEQGAIHHE